MMKRTAQPAQPKPKSHTKELDNLFADRSTEKKDINPIQPGETPEEHDLKSLKKINDHLRETTSMMINELDRMSLVSASMHSTSGKFSRTSSVMDEYSEKMKHGDKHMAILRRRQRQNYIMIYGSFAFFLFCVIYVLVKRLFYNKATTFISFFVPSSDL